MSWRSDSDDPVIGKRYRVSARDCCVAFEFESELIDVTFMEQGDVSNRNIDELQFANGVKILEDGNVRLRAV